MRTITPESFTVYTLDELAGPARQRAIDTVAEKRATVWWDSFDNEHISETLVAEFAQRLNTPGWDDYGIGDFPGIPGVTLERWSLDRSQELEFKGELDRDNAPALPWAEGVKAVHLGDDGTHLAIYVETDYDPFADTDGTGARVEHAAEQMREAVRTALAETWRDGYAEMEYLCGEQAAEEDIRANEREFYADGELYA